MSKVIPAHLVRLVVLVMISKPSLGFLLVLAILETVINDDSQIVPRHLLAHEGVEVALLDEDDTFLVAWDLAQSMESRGI